MIPFSTGHLYFRGSLEIILGSWAKVFSGWNVLFNHRWIRRDLWAHEGPWCLQMSYQIKPQACSLANLGGIGCTCVLLPGSHPPSPSRIDVVGRRGLPSVGSFKSSSDGCGMQLGLSITAMGHHCLQQRAAFAGPTDRGGRNLLLEKSSPCWCISIQRILPSLVNMRGSFQKKNRKFFW